MLCFHRKTPQRLNPSLPKSSEAYLCAPTSALPLFVLFFFFFYISRSVNSEVMCSYRFLHRCRSNQTGVEKNNFWDEYESISCTWPYFISTAALSTRLTTVLTWCSLVLKFLSLSLLGYSFWILFSIFEPIFWFVSSVAAVSWDPFSALLLLTVINDIYVARQIRGWWWVWFVSWLDCWFSLKLHVYDTWRAGLPVFNVCLLQSLGVDSWRPFGARDFKNVSALWMPPQPL